jgi:hypothetical protein
VSHYASGTRFEHKVRDDLVDNGYEVIRAAGSKGSSKVDLAAFKPGQLLFVQCKSNGALPPAEWDRVFEVSRWVSALPLLASNGPHGRGVVYTRLLGPKVPRARTQHCVAWSPDELAPLDAAISPLEAQEGQACGAGPSNALGANQRHPSAEAWAMTGGV